MHNLWEYLLLKYGAGGGTRTLMTMSSDFKSDAYTIRLLPHSGTHSSP